VWWTPRYRAGRSVPSSPAALRLQAFLAVRIHRRVQSDWAESDADAGAVDADEDGGVDAAEAAAAEAVAASLGPASAVAFGPSCRWVAPADPHPVMVAVA